MTLLINPISSHFSFFLFYTTKRYPCVTLDIKMLWLGFLCGSHSSLEKLDYCSNFFSSSQKDPHPFCILTVGTNQQLPPCTEITWFYAIPTSPWHMFMFMPLVHTVASGTCELSSAPYEGSHTAFYPLWAVLFVRKSLNGTNAGPSFVLWNYIEHS